MHNVCLGADVCGPLGCLPNEKGGEERDPLTGNDVVQ